LGTRTGILSGKAFLEQGIKRQEKRAKVCAHMKHHDRSVDCRRVRRRIDAPSKSHSQLEVNQTEPKNPAAGMLIGRGPYDSVASLEEELVTPRRTHHAQLQFDVLVAIPDLVFGQSKDSSIVDEAVYACPLEFAGSLENGGS
jgi:hypothetical protein